MKIGVFDSGKGGTTVLAAIRELLPDEEYQYIADSEHCPYGEKSDEELMGIVTSIVEELKDWGARIIVIACNTATTRCIERLRGQYPQLKFVGTEPAIRLAARSNARKILVMATPGTIESERLSQLLAENQKPGQQIDLLACPGLADAIEHDDKVEEVLNALLCEVDKEYDAVVLGCTHYSLIRPLISRAFPGAALIDGNQGVARQVQKLAREME